MSIQEATSKPATVAATSYSDFNSLLTKEFKPKSEQATFVRGWDPLQNPLHVNEGKDKCRLVQNKVQHSTSSSNNNSIMQVEVTCIR